MSNCQTLEPVLGVSNLGVCSPGHPSFTAERSKDLRERDSRGLWWIMFLVRQVRWVRESGMEWCVVGAITWFDQICPKTWEGFAVPRLLLCKKVARQGTVTVLEWEATQSVIRRGIFSAPQHFIFRFFQTATKNTAFLGKQCVLAQV